MTAYELLQVSEQAGLENLSIQPLQCDTLRALKIQLDQYSSGAGDTSDETQLQAVTLMADARCRFRAKNSTARDPREVQSSDLHFSVLTYDSNS